ncbi:MAG: LysE family transporter [Rhizobiaceae bacterium]
MIAFMLAVLFLVGTPGPGVLSTAGVGAGYGFNAGLRYVAGLFVGNNLVTLAVITGLAAIVLSVPAIRIALFSISLLYLLWLAARIAFAGSKLAFISQKSPPGFINGLLLQIINPKVYVVGTALFSGFPFMPESLALEAGLKLVMLNVIWVPIHLVWLWAGAVLHRLDLAPRTHFLINLAMASAMLAVVGIAAWSTFIGMAGG